jgi:nucleoside-triphosphatase
MIVRVGELKHIFFVTGSPGIGKTTILLKIAEALEKKGYKLGGMLSREAREEEARVGFEIIDIETKKHGWLAHVQQSNGPQVGKYRVNLADLESIGALAIRNATVNAQIVIIDEIGPMELHSSAFKEAVTEALSSGKPVIGVIHERAKDSLINSIRKRDDTQIIQVTRGNRERIHNLLIEKVNQLLREKELSSS